MYIRFITATLLCLVTINACAEQALADDWVKFICSKKANRLCGGYYLQPKYPLAATKGYATDTTVINADQTKLVAKGLSTFTGNVLVAKNDQQLQADNAKVQQNQEGDVVEVEAIGNVKLIELGLRVDGSRGKLLNQDDYKVIYDARYRLYDQHARGNAKQIEVFGDDVMLLPDASYTTCAPGSDTWQLRANQVKLDRQAGRGEAWGSKLYIHKVPVLYWPYVNFPIDKRRKTGFLYPSFSTNSRHGKTITVPFYWNIAANYDYTLNPSYMTKRGTKLDNKFRYLTNNSSGAVKFNFLEKDRGYQSFRKEKVTADGISKSDLRYRQLRDLKRRYALGYVQQTTLNKNWLLDLDYTKVSDDNYLYDFGQDVGNTVDVTNTDFGQYIEEPNQSGSTHLKQSASLENANPYGVLRLNVSQYQTLYPFDGPLSNEQFKKLPQIVWGSNYIYLHKARARYQASYTQFRMRKFPDVTTSTTGNRWHFRPSLEIPYERLGWYAKPRLQVDMLSYGQLKLNQQDRLSNKPANTTRAIPIFDVDSGMNFVRNMKVSNEAWQQTLEPRLYYLHTPFRDQSRFPVFDSNTFDFDYNQLFRDNRYGGLDRISEADQVTLAVKTRFYPTATGEEKASLAIGRIRYLRGLTAHLGEDLQFNRWSPLAALLHYHISPSWLLEANVVREKINKTRSNTIVAQYRPDEDRVLNLGYHFRRNDKFEPNSLKPLHEHQAQFSTAWAVSDYIKLLGKFDYDLNYRRAAYSLLGVEWHSCCTIFRFAWVRNLLPSANPLDKKYNNGFRLSLVLKGFAGTGNLESGFLASKIAGYNQKEGF